MSHDDLDIRIADALFEAAATTTTDADALNQIVRRAESARTRAHGHRVVVGGLAAAVVGLGAAGIVVLNPGSTSAPGSSSTVVSAPDRTEPTDVTPGTLPVAGYVEGDLIYDDATLLSQLFVNFGVGGVEDESRIRTESGIADADHAAMAECMSDRGWQYFVPTGSWRDALSEHPLFTMEPDDFAAQYGFGFAAQALGLLEPVYAPDESGFDDYMRTLSADEQHAYAADEGACQEEVGLYDDVPIFSQAWVNAKDYAWTQFEPIVRNDDRVAAALDTWQRCMAAAGFTYDRPDLIGSEFGVRLHEFGLFGSTAEEGTAEYDAIEAIFEEEVAVATANAACVPPYDEVLRDVVTERLPEWKAMLQAAIDAGVEGGGAAG